MHTSPSVPPALPLLPEPGPKFELELPDDWLAFDEEPLDEPERAGVPVRGVVRLAGLADFLDFFALIGLPIATTGLPVAAIVAPATVTTGGAAFEPVTAAGASGHAGSAASDCSSGSMPR